MQLPAYFVRAGYKYYNMDQEVVAQALTVYNKLRERSEEWQTRKKISRTGKLKLK